MCTVDFLEIFKELIPFVTKINPHYRLIFFLNSAEQGSKQEL